jgi:hypothetical protein
MLPSFMSVALPSYLPPNHLSYHITFLHIGFIQAFLGAFTKLQKRLLALSCMAVHLSVSLHGTTWVSLDGFLKN